MKRLFLWVSEVIESEDIILVGEWLVGQLEGNVKGFLVCISNLIAWFCPVG